MMRIKLVGIMVIMLLFIIPFQTFGLQLTLENENSDFDEQLLINNKDDVEYWAVVVVAFNETKTHVYDALVGANNWNPSNIKLLNRENATKEAILEALDWLKEKADTNDIVIFADNSHGTIIGNLFTGAYGIVPWDSRESGIITTKELDEKFDAIDVEGMCLIFDCCLSGNFVDEKTCVTGKTYDFTQFNKGFISGVEGDNRVVLMSTRKYGAGFHMNIRNNKTGKNMSISFSKFIADALVNKIDSNNDNICSAEETFYYAQIKFRPYALFMFLLMPFQLQLLLTTGFILIPFPTLYDNYPGELPLVNV